MAPCRAKLVMNWYLRRPKQAQGTPYIPSTPSSVCSAMADRGEERQRAHTGHHKLTSRQLVNQVMEAVGFGVTGYGFILLLCSQLMDTPDHGPG